MEESGSATLEYKKMHINSRISLFVKVEVYEVRYTGLGGEEVEEEEVHPDTLQQDNVILLNFPGASSPNLNLEARIKYQNFNSYSPWIQSADPSVTCFL